MTQKERLEEIRKKHEEEQRKRKFFLRRLMIGASAAVLVVVIALIIGFSISAISHRIEEKRQLKEEIAEALAATSSPSATIDPNVISQSFYNNSAFIGNSFVDDLFMFNFLDNADYFGKTGLTVDSAMSETLPDGDVPVVEELNGDKQYDKIFMMFGENELGWADEDIFSSTYEELIEQVREYQPRSRIYLLAITPVTQETSDEDIDSTNNERVRAYNEYIKGVAARENAVFADIYKAVADKDGALPKDSANDGVHFGKDYYEKCLLYIQNNY